MSAPPLDLGTLVTLGSLCDWKLGLSSLGLSRIRWPKNNKIFYSYTALQAKRMDQGVSRKPLSQLLMGRSLPFPLASGVWAILGIPWLYTDIAQQLHGCLFRHLPCVSILPFHEVTSCLELGPNPFI